VQITIREALPAESAAAGDLTAAVYQNEALADPTYIPRLRDAAARHAAPDAWQLVALDDTGRILGAAVYAVAGSDFADIATGEEAEIRMLATAEAARGRGVGQALVMDCVRRTREQERSALVLSTKPQMVAAQRLYARLGFARTPARDWEYAPGEGLLTFRYQID
jgi:ribosomal protein S18 acetylase RimI-like enzyme